MRFCFRSATVLAITVLLLRPERANRKADICLSKEIAKMLGFIAEDESVRRKKRLHKRLHAYARTAKGTARVVASIRRTKTNKASISDNNEISGQPPLESIVEIGEARPGIPNYVTLNKSYGPAAWSPRPPNILPTDDAVPSTSAQWVGCSLFFTLVLLSFAHFGYGFVDVYRTFYVPTIFELSEERNAGWIGSGCYQWAKWQLRFQTLILAIKRFFDPVIPSIVIRWYSWRNFR